MIVFSKQVHILFISGSFACGCLFGRFSNCFDSCLSRYFMCPCIDTKMEGSTQEQGRLKMYLFFLILIMFSVVFPCLLNKIMDS